jgi:DnaJ-class molecular chaperone
VEIVLEEENSLTNKMYEEWDSSEEEICPSCKGTGLDKWEEYDCETCYGEGVLPPLLSDLPELTGVQRSPIVES